MRCYQNIMVGDDRYVPFSSNSPRRMRFDPVRDPQVMTKYRLAFGLLIQLNRVPTAAQAFRALPYGYDLLDLLQSSRIWYYCDMTLTTGTLFGLSITNGFSPQWWDESAPTRPELNDMPAQISVAATRFNQGYRHVAGTLLHELAHVNGAPGGDLSQQAESVLIPFGLGDIFDPNVFGAVSPTNQTTAVA